MSLYSHYFSHFNLVGPDRLSRTRVGMMIPVMEMRMIETPGCKCLTKYSIAPKWLNLRSRLLTLFQCQMSEKLKPRTITLETYSYYNFIFFVSLSVVSNICRYARN